MAPDRTLRIGITCYPSVGGSGILASALGEELARRGHEVHFISYERPFRLPLDAPRLYFHPVEINDYGLFKYPDYTLPLSVKMAEVSRDIDWMCCTFTTPCRTRRRRFWRGRCCRRSSSRDRHDAARHGHDVAGPRSGYGPAIRHALSCSDAVTTVSAYLRTETQRLLGDRAADRSDPQFFAPRPPQPFARRRCATSWASETRCCSCTPRISPGQARSICCWKRLRA